jgi:hypothetical protein
LGVVGKVVLVSGISTVITSAIPTVISGAVSII